MPTQARESTKVRERTRKQARKAKERERRVGVSFEERFRMIAENAYYRAERRGFRGSHHVRDWLEAESEIDRILIDPEAEG
jgi:hypothetical protein